MTETDLEDGAELSALLRAGRDVKEDRICAALEDGVLNTRK